MLLLGLTIFVVCTVVLKETEKKNRKKVLAAISQVNER
jgi:hypothetical protein